MAFWTLELAGFLAIYYFVNQFLSGALVRSNSFRLPCESLPSSLPFSGSGLSPLTSISGSGRGGRGVAALALQLFWVLALYALARVVWRAALRHVVVQGG